MNVHQPQPALQLVRSRPVVVNIRPVEFPVRPSQYAECTGLPAGFDRLSNKLSAELFAAPVQVSGPFVFASERGAT